MKSFVDFETQFKNKINYPLESHSSRQTSQLRRISSRPELKEGNYSQRISFTFGETNIKRFTSPEPIKISKKESLGDTEPSTPIECEETPMRINILRSSEYISTARNEQIDESFDNASLMPTIPIKATTARSIISVLSQLSDRSEGLSVVMELPMANGKL